MVVTKKLGVRLGGSATSQQVLKMKIDGAPRTREAPLESAVWQATLRLSPSASLGASAKQGRLSRKAREGAHPRPPPTVVENVLVPMA